MPQRALASTYASLFAVALAACAPGDEAPARFDLPTGPTCSVQMGLSCSCPGGGFGQLSCDGLCGSCAAPSQAGAAAPVPAASGGGMRAVDRGPAPAAPAPDRAPAGGMSMVPVSRSIPPAADSGGSDDGMMQPAPTVSGEVPETAACEAVGEWPAQSAEFEAEVLRLVNINRGLGWNCDTEGQKPPAGPLAMDGTLRCSARLHSKDMADRMFFAHDNPDGENPGDRMFEVGYMGNTWGENIAAGQQTPAEVVQAWMDSDGHCANIMHPAFNLIGVGFYLGMATNPRFNSELYWTQNFGATTTAGRRR